MKHGRRERVVAGFFFALLAARPVSAQPGPTADQTGDNVRIIEWEPPVPIPGLSRWASLWLGRAATRPIPPAIAARLYAERASLIRHFAASAELSAFWAGSYH